MSSPHEYSVLTLDFPSADAAEFAIQIGFSAVAIDLDTTPISAAELADIARAAQLRGGELAVKTHWSRGQTLVTALNVGATVIQLAGITNESDIRSAVHSMTLGEGRGVQRTRLVGWGDAPDAYAELFVSPGPRVVAIVESAEGLRNSGPIAQLNAVDVVFFGAFDLSVDMGFPGQPRHPVVRQAVDEAIERMQGHARIGLSASTKADARAARKRGARYILSAQTRLMSQTARAILSSSDTPKTRVEEPSHA